MSTGDTHLDSIWFQKAVGRFARGTEQVGSKTSILYPINLPRTFPFMPFPVLHLNLIGLMSKLASSPERFTNSM
jgi:hypothetical protein